MTQTLGKRRAPDILQLRSVAVISGPYQDLQRISVHSMCPAGQRGPQPPCITEASPARGSREIRRPRCCSTDCTVLIAHTVHTQQAVKADARGHGGQRTSDKRERWSGWRDLNSRPLDPQIGPRLLSCVNNLSLVSIVDRCRALSSAGVVRSWSVVSPHSPGALVIANPVGASVSSVLRQESGSYALQWRGDGILPAAAVVSR
jgi:hypothetical protein